MRTPGKWVRLSRAIYRNHKVMSLVHSRRKGAVCTYMLALAWCGDEGTDGFVPDYALPVFYATEAEADALAAIGLWDATEGGWQIHDWSAWQESNEATRAKSERARKAVNKRWRGEEETPASNVRRIPNRDPA